ncbi:MAG: hypothetical protein M3Y41_07950 [Pseudomonadota bacterium]|nr:hypothetical protein [Pseudomonadota bacterium]
MSPQEPGKLPPFNFQAEAALIGALLTDVTIDIDALHLAGEYFADPVHGLIFRAIACWLEVGQIADVATLTADLAPSGVLDEVGGPAYLLELAAAPAKDAVAVAAVIRDTWARRRLIDIGEEIATTAFGECPAMDTAQQLRLARQKICKLAAEVLL